MPLYQSTGDPGGRRALSGRDDDAHAIVTTSSHGAASGVDHEADQEPDGGQKCERTEEKSDGRYSEAVNRKARGKNNRRGEG